MILVSERVCCCVPVRIGVLLISIILSLVYLALFTLMFVKHDDMYLWATSIQEVDTALTDTAFNGVFAAFACVTMGYAVTSVFGIIAIVLQHRRVVRIYHVANWIFVLLILTSSLAYWIYFKVKQDVYVNDCQDLVNKMAGLPEDSPYSRVIVPHNKPIAGGNDKQYCIDLINKLVIASGVVVFVGNAIQIYFASSIGVYATSLKRHYQHQRLQDQDDDEIMARKLME
ncbi:uncharacterized protein BYT42DRAFT_571046 [Radiomyces spectabilis]|uniref:uncharacterized protein n=1 Tax=Radiomyces spectabilis TaxID=64574 RepID=UPI00221EE506|nr:uncharacterized protein BYT42DRAFT_571046 [Radiomyces spectabilis]KAI8377640.1 hypothetical protein BYT42DRAFT_571046 [Radiomyces spectabilis]